MKTKPWPHSAGIIAVNEYYSNNGALLATTYEGRYGEHVEEFLTYKEAEFWIDMQKHRETVIEPMFAPTTIAEEMS